MMSPWTPQPTVRGGAGGLARSLVRTLLVVSGVAGGVFATGALTDPSFLTHGAIDGATRPATQKATTDRVSRLVTEHGCWTGAAPRSLVGKVPGHVVVTLDGELRYSSRLVSAALDHVFTAPREDMVVHAFCP